MIELILPHAAALQSRPFGFAILPVQLRLFHIFLLNKTSESFPLCLVRDLAEGKMKAFISLISVNGRGKI